MSGTMNTSIGDPTVTRMSYAIVSPAFISKRYAVQWSTGRVTVSVTVVPTRWTVPWNPVAGAARAVSARSATATRTDRRPGDRRIGMETSLQCGRAFLNVHRRRGPGNPYSLPGHRAAGAMSGRLSGHRAPVTGGAGGSGGGVGRPPAAGGGPVGGRPPTSAGARREVGAEGPA